MKRSIGVPALALFAIITALTMALSSCSNPSSAPATPQASYSASAFFNTESLGDTTTTPFPFCFPAAYLQQKLGLTDSQVTALQNLQDSLRLAFQTRLTALKASGSWNIDSVRALRLDFQTALYKGVAGILTPSQFAELQSLEPPQGPREWFGRGGRHHGPENDADMSVANLAIRESMWIARTEQVLAQAGDTLTANQIILIQNLQEGLRADTTLTRDARRAEFDAQLQTILTANQLAVLRSHPEGDMRHRRHH